MARYQTSRILPIILVFVIIIIAIAAIVSLARVVFFSGDTTTTVETDTSQQSLLNTSPGHSVSMMIRGPIVANEEFHSYQITISPNSRVIKTYVGYLDKVVASKSLDNNVAAYEEFVYALDKANLVKGTELEGDQNDVRGVCATGRVYEYSVLENGESVKTLWTSTCKGSPGSLDASTEQLNELFINQIPGAKQLIRDVNL